MTYERFAHAEDMHDVLDDAIRDIRAALDRLEERKSDMKGYINALYSIMDEMQTEYDQHGAVLEDAEAEEMSAKMAEYWRMAI